MRSLTPLKVKILCVDDQPANLTSLEAALGHLDYELILVGSGAAALTEVDRHSFAAILLDIQMPVLDGFKTAKLLRGNPRSASTPIIFMTANYPSEEYMLRGYEAGAVDYLLKPLNIDFLKAKLAVFVDLFKKTREIRRQATLLMEIERREQERALAKCKRVSERKYQNLVEGIREGIVWSIHPKTYCASFVSRHAEKITGYPLSDWTKGAPFWIRCLLPEDRNQLEHYLETAQNDTCRFAMEHPFIKANGARIWLYTEGHLDTIDETGESEIQGLSVDITHLKETEQALRDAVRVREDFLSVASHELKTPITPLQLQLQCFLRMLENGKIASTPIPLLRNMLETSDAQVTRLSRLICQLLDVSKINEGRINLALENVNLSALVHDVVAQLRHELEASKCSLSLQLDHRIEGRWDRLRLEQVLINLITNSTKYAAGKPIEIILSRQSGRAILKVKDHGMGIAKEDLGRVFGRFERAVPLKNFGGLGLGLYISQQIIQMHQGSIQIESVPPHGATLTVELPINAPSDVRAI